MMRHRDLLAVLALLLPLIAVVVGNNTNAEWKPIPSTTDPGVVANARFAVSAYDKKEGEHLVFVNVVEGNYTRGASGNIYYQLIVKAKDARFGTSNNYNTVVRDYLDGRRDLIGFW